MLDSIKEVLITEEALRERVAELGKQISADYKGEDVVLVCVLKGAVVFFADLARAIEGNVALDFISCSSYGNSTESSGVVRILKDLDKPVEGKHVIVVEDIVDTGQTMQRLLETLGTRGPKEIHIASLLVKPDKLKVDLNIEYVAMNIPNDFIVGYGLDYDGFGRNYPDIYTVVD